MKIVLEGEKPQSWNAYYAGKHWTERHAEVARVRALVLASLPLYVAMFKCPVTITLTAFFKGRSLDPDNICAKIYIDALCGRVLEDDTPSHVHSVTTASRVDRENPRIEIEIRPSL